MKHHTDYLIIGGGIAGTTAAETIRQLDDRGSIAIVSKEPYELYSRVLLPAYIERRIRREQVFLRSSQDYTDRRIDLFIPEEVAIVDLKRKEIRTKQDSVFFFKKLLIAAGGRVKPWRVASTDPVPVYRLQTIDDADVLIENVGSLKSEIIIVGGGFIALELLNALIPRHVSARVLVPENRYWDWCLDKTGSDFLEMHLERHGVIIQRAEIPTQLSKSESGGITVYTNKRNAYEAGAIAVGMGLEREVTPFTGLGIEVNRGIKTNEFLETAAEDVWAAGDIAEYFHPIYKKHLLVGNWSNAFLQGHIAGSNMVSKHLYNGVPEVYARIPLYAIDVLGMHIAFLGDVDCKNSKACEFVTRFQENLFYERFVIHQRKLVGAILINKFEDRQILEKLMTDQTDITPFMKYFTDASVTLSEVFQ